MGKEFISLGYIIINLHINTTPSGPLMVYSSSGRLIEDGRDKLIHILNPLQIYSRIRDIGCPKILAKYITKLYEKTAFPVFKGSIDAAIYVRHRGDNGQDFPFHKGSNGNGKGHPYQMPLQDAPPIERDQEEYKAMTREPINL